MTPEQIMGALKALSVKDFMALLTDIIDLATDYCDFSCIYSDCDYCDADNDGIYPCDVDYGDYCSCPCDNCVMRKIKR